MEIIPRYTCPGRGPGPPPLFYLATPPSPVKVSYCGHFFNSLAEVHLKLKSPRGFTPGHLIIDGQTL